MILFSEIFDKAINLFDDPDIKHAYFYDKVKFAKVMRPYLLNGVNLFTNPTKISFLLVDMTDPVGKLEINNGDGGKEYSLSSIPAENSVMSFKISGEVDPGAIYDKVANKVTFSKNVPKKSEWSVEWYYAGSFTTDFKSAAVGSVPADVIASRVKEILARALVLCWSENEKNFALDIRNILTDTDFKLYSPANSINAKTAWVKQLRFDFDSMQTKLAWDCYSRKWTGGNYYG